jgi:hypothetical protein
MPRKHTDVYSTRCQPVAKYSKAICASGDFVFMPGQVGTLSRKEGARSSLRFWSRRNCLSWPTLPANLCVGGKASVVVPAFG